jgi:hypothetical protein
VPQELAVHDWELNFGSSEELGAAFERDFKRGRALVSCAEPRELQSHGVLLIRLVGASSFELPTTVVWQSPDNGSLGLQFDDWTEARCAELRAYIDFPRKRAPNLYDRIRALTLAEQQQMARSGSQAERVALERCYSGSVWESLLQNPNLSPPEVASIAKKGGLPRPVLSQIAANASWIAVPEIQRALLSNPRLDQVGVQRVLKAMPRSELQTVTTQTRYTPQIRSHAKRLLKQ